MNDDDVFAENGPDGAKQKARKQRVPAKVTPKNLENVALHYLERFSTSCEGLRRVLMRRVRRSSYHHGTDADEAKDWVDQVVDKMRARGFVNDRLFAEGRVRTLLAQGVPLRGIRMRLREKGIADDIVADVVDLVAADDGDVDLAAAIALAKRRRLGPFITRADREQRRDKDLAALARAGFGYDIARRVIDAESVEALEDMKRDDAGAGGLGYFRDED
jgi:regulatory protein